MSTTLEVHAWRPDDAVIVGGGGLLFLVDLESGSTDVISPTTEQNLYARGYWNDDVPAAAKSAALLAAALKSASQEGT